MIMINLDKKTASICISDDKYHFQSIDKDCKKWISTNGKTFTMSEMINKLKSNLK